MKSTKKRITLDIETYPAAFIVTALVDGETWQEYVVSPTAPGYPNEVDCGVVRSWLASLKDYGWTVTYNGKNFDLRVLAWIASCGKQTMTTYEIADAASKLISDLNAKFGNPKSSPCWSVKYGEVLKLRKNHFDVLKCYTGEHSLKWWEQARGWPVKESSVPFDQQTMTDGVNSTYNIVVGRSRSVNGPFCDNIGRNMIAGGGKMVDGAGDRVVGPGHFGRTIIDKGVEIMSCHYEADFDQGGRSVLGIRPLLWQNGWPQAGSRFHGGTFEIESERRGYALELGTDFVRIPQERRFWGAPDTAKVRPMASQSLEDVIDTWPKGEISVRCNDYMFRPNQRWTITAVPDSGGYLGQPYYKIVIEGTNRALAATAQKELTTVANFTGDGSQLWRIEQLTDGTFRIMPKVIPGMEGINEHLCLYSAGDSTPTLAEYDFDSDNSKWNLKQQ